MDGRQEWEVELNETEGTRAQGTHGHGAAVQEQAAGMPTTYIFYCCLYTIIHSQIRD